MKQFFITLGGILFLFGAHSAQMVNVEYIHNAIQQKWDITIPYNSELTNPQVAANMKYLLTAIDVANQKNGVTSNYGNSEFATLVVADTVATDTAIDTLIKQSAGGEEGEDEEDYDDNAKYKFSITHNFNTYSSGYTIASNPDKIFRISAAGTFNIDWGDGTEEVIEKNDTNDTWYGHAYPSNGTYTIQLGGKATDYSDEEHVAAISFAGASVDDYFAESNFFATKMSGCLGCIFSTLDDGTQPRFVSTFANASTASEPLALPSNLFRGISGAPASYMFEYTFSASDIEEIPEKLFSGISGEPAEGVFNGTFSLTKIHSIPAGLFAGINGAPAPHMFDSTFMDCSKLTAIPEGLFSGIDGPPAKSMFVGTFAYCYNLTGIPDKLFANISGDEQYMMFGHTFAYCSNLTSASASTNAGLLYKIWPNATSNAVVGMYSGCDGLSDYANIPNAWK